jgi:RNA ligase
MNTTINHIDDLKPFVEDKKEIRFMDHPNGTTVACYMFMDSKTFDSPQALECRGIAFDREGLVVSRPLHKFFNVGEKEWLTPDNLLKREDIVAIYEKLDGSMIATAWIDGKLEWRSKKAFDSEVVKLTKDILGEPENSCIGVFAENCARNGKTAIFELTHPDARIVVSQPKAQLRLLHVRDNLTGEYLTLDPFSPVSNRARELAVPMCPRYTSMEFKEALESLEMMKDMEGYVIQFSDGDMVKMKCPWYLRLHRSITFLRERDIAVLSLHEELDDVKQSLTELGIDLKVVEEVETRLKGILTEILDQVEAMYAAGKNLSRKEFALQYQGHQYFGLGMQRYLGKEVDLPKWYEQKRLKEEFSLRVLTDAVLTEAMEG